MSFPDPHHPWDPPASEARRINWRDLDLPPGHPGSREKIEKILAQKPRHWLDWYQGRFRNEEGGAWNFVPCQMTHDQVREINALVHVKNELIDEACGRVLATVAARGWDADTDVFFTTDHGELQGDFGLLFKGPYHVDALMRVPLIWRPAPSAKMSAAEVSEPVGHLDLAPTFCAIAGAPIPDWMQGSALPTAAGSPRVRAITEWDSQFAQLGMHLRSIYRDGFVCTVYEPSTRGVGFDLSFGYKALGIDGSAPRHSLRRHRGRAVRFARGPAAMAQSLERRGAREAEVGSDCRPVRQSAARAHAAIDGRRARLNSHRSSSTTCCGVTAVIPPKVVLFRQNLFSCWCRGVSRFRASAVSAGILTPVHTHTKHGDSRRVRLNSSSLNLTGRRGYSLASRD